MAYVWKRNPDFICLRVCFVNQASEVFCTFDFRERVKFFFCWCAEEFLKLLKQRIKIFVNSSELIYSGIPTLFSDGYRNNFHRPSSRCRHCILYVASFNKFLRFSVFSVKYRVLLKAVTLSLLQAYVPFYSKQRATGI